MRKTIKVRETFLTFGHFVAISYKDYGSPYDRAKVRMTDRNTGELAWEFDVSISSAKARIRALRQECAPQQLRA